MTKQHKKATGSPRQAGALSSDEVDVPPAMIDAGLEVYLQNASHDEMSFLSSRELVTQILQAAISQDRGRTVLG